MIRALVFLALLFAGVTGIGWLASNGGTVEVIWLNQIISVPAVAALGILLVLLFGFMIVWKIVFGVLGSPKKLGRFFGSQRIKKGHQALSHGLIAVGSGDARAALRFAHEARRLIPEDPATRLLEAQAAQLSGNRDTARGSFEAMLDVQETEILGLRGLYMEAERQGALDAKRHFALEAHKRRPGLAWAGQAVLDVYVAERDWDSAIKALESNSHNKIIDKKDARRLKAVLLTARAMELELSSPDRARSMAIEAHDLLPDFAPSSVLAGRLLTRHGDIRRASKVLEATWRKEPHPEVALAYLDVRPGDAARDRMKRAKTLAELRANHPEGPLVLAQAAIDARDWSTAREALAKVLRSQPTERACLMMADVEEGEHNDLGRVREWLSRAVQAPPDPVWVADGVISEQWAPVSPVTGDLDAFRWRVPAENPTEQRLTIEEALFAPRAAPALQTAASSPAPVATSGPATAQADAASDTSSSSKSQAETSKSADKSAADAATETTKPANASVH